MASSSQVYLCSAMHLPCKKARFGHRSLQVRAQTYKDHQEGRSSNVVDANLRVLRERIEEVKTRERLERCSVADMGWNYGAVDYSRMKRKRDEEMLAGFLELVRMICGTFGLTILTSSFFLCFVSLLVHLFYR